MSNCVIDNAGCIVCAGIPATPGSPATTSLLPNLGWNAGGDSVDSFDGNLHAVFTMVLVAGAVVGFKPDATGTPDPSRIQFGLQFQTVSGFGFVNIVESGIPIGPAFEYAAGDTFEIRRYNGYVSYLHGDSVIRTSLVRSGGPLIVSASLFAAGDTVGAVTFETLSEHTPGTVSIPGLASTVIATDATNFASFDGVDSSITASGHTGLRVAIDGIVSSVIATDVANFASFDGLDSTITASYFSPPSVAMAYFNGLDSSATIIAHKTSHIELAINGLVTSVLATDVSSFASFDGIDSSIYATDVGPFDGAYVIALQSPGYVSMGAGSAVVNVREVIGFAGALTTHVLFEIFEQLQFEAAGASNLHGLARITDGIGMADQLTVIWQQLVVDRIKVGGVLTPTLTAIAEVTEVMSLLAGSSNAITARNSVATALALFDTLNVLAREHLADQIKFNAVQSSNLVAQMQVVDGIAAAALLTPGVRFVMLVDESITFADTPASMLRAFEMLTDGIEMCATIRIGDDVYAAWVINTTNKAFSEYTNYPFNGFADDLEGTWYGCAADGIYELEGPDDNGVAINAAVRTGLSNLGNGKMKRMPDIYFGYTASKGVVVKVLTTTDDGEKIESWYEMAPQAANVVREGRVKVGRNLKSVHWQFEIINVDGGTLGLDDIKLYPSILDRRVRR
jgi:hypothetical protein